MKTAVNTSVQPFSAGYAITEFDLEVGDFEEVQISSYRAEDIREWWLDVEGGRPVPVVLRTEKKHLVPAESDDLAYEKLRVPAEMINKVDTAAFLIPDTRHTRMLMGFE